MQPRLSPPAAPTETRPPTLGFFLEHVAGHGTHAATLRSALAHESDIRQVWREINYRQPGGRLEAMHDRLPRLPYYPFGVTRAVLQLREAFNSGPYDAVLLNSRVAMFATDWVRRVPCVLDTDVTPVQLDRLPGYPGPKDPPPVAALKHRLFRRFLHSLRGIIAWSNWAAASFRDDYGVPPERVHVIPPGVDLDFWRPGPPKPADRTRPIRLLFVGGDFRRKGGELLLRWFGEYAPPNCELHIVTRESVPTRPGVTVYHDVQPNTPFLRSLYQMADLFVMPSEGECFGIATLEAMACGLPVVVSDVGGARDIVEHGTTGLLVPPGDRRALHMQLMSIIADGGARCRLGRRGRSRAEQHFSGPRSAAMRLSILSQAASVA